jgi:hypothetical protein
MPARATRTLLRVASPLVPVRAGDGLRRRLLALQRREPEHEGQQRHGDALGVADSQVADDGVGAGDGSGDTGGVVELSLDNHEVGWVTVSLAGLRA